MSKLFGTDGVRGVANQDLTPEMIFAIGRAHGYYLRQERARPVVVVGRDSRLSGSMLESAYVAGLTSSGSDVYLAGLLPTPGVAFLVRHLECQGGAVLSASHNPIQDNGIKLFRSDGYKLDDDQCRGLEQLIRKAGELPRPVGEEVGKVIETTDLDQLYHDFLTEAAPATLTGLKIVLDCAHGAACGHAKKVFSRLGAEVVSLSDQPDGAFINVRCGSTDLSALTRAVTEQKAHFGLAFDGDADRCLAVDAQGEAVDGDQIMLVLARWLKSQGRLPGQMVVATVMSNLGLELALKEADIVLDRTQVGDRYVLERMKERGALLGGEQSGHILLLDRSTSGDGILTGLTLAAILNQERADLAELASMRRFPQRLVNVPARNKELLNSDLAIAEQIKKQEERLSSRGRILVRPSGTEPLVRVMVEGSSQQEMDSVLEELTDFIRQRLA